MLWPLVVASRRVLGVRIRTVRAQLGAMAGWLAVGQLLGWLLPSFHESPGLVAGLLIPIAGCVFLATLTFLFLAEMAFPAVAGWGSSGGCGRSGGEPLVRGGIRRSAGSR
jgi:ubiquinone biosynthesis protein